MSLPEYFLYSFDLFVLDSDHHIMGQLKTWTEIFPKNKKNTAWTVEHVFPNNRCVGCYGKVVSAHYISVVVVWEYLGNNSTRNTLNYSQYITIKFWPVSTKLHQTMDHLKYGFEHVQHTNTEVGCMDDLRILCPFQQYFSHIRLMRVKKT